MVPLPMLLLDYRNHHAWCRGGRGGAGGSRKITSYRVHPSCRSQVEIDPAERSPKVDFTMVLVLRSEELGRTAYMGVQPTHGTVQDRKA